MIMPYGVEIFARVLCFIHSFIHVLTFCRAGGEDDFEIFLANVKARSVAARAQITGQGDASSPNSSTEHTKRDRDRSLTEGSSLDLEWDHEAGTFCGFFLSQFVF